MKLSRRAFLAVGLAGTATCGTLGWFRACHYPGSERFRDLRALDLVTGSILAAVVDTVVPDLPGAPRTRAAVDAHVRAIDAYLVGLPRETLTATRQALYGLEHLSLRRFTRLGRRARAEALARWQASASDGRRAAFRELTALVFLSHYRTQPAFDAVGYPGPSLPGGGGTPEQRARYAALVATAGARPRGKAAAR